MNFKMFPLQVGDIKPGETVLVTAAAGGTGQIAVSLPKNEFYFHSLPCVKT